MNVTATSPVAQGNRDLLTLQNTLQTGNLQGAQVAFASFLQDVQRIAPAGGAASLFAPGTQAGHDLQALEGALKSANLNAARQAFTSFEQDLEVSGQELGLSTAAPAAYPASFAQNASQTLSSNGTVNWQA